ncbi:hypothetical protein N7468_006787 [Penicillium chermesinum]|uniref:Uncharacterized protein n=1 Tax=Penicillium chermesinum TaxID=63820 RepID=A0A9W9NSY9_9EURO|nr:uncharacterized protein N7468_006787 [Penicillium chermesinum]KAJ5225562.1 hypothetical protein N7468_006787 [Penicillium chermesinum]
MASLLLKSMMTRSSLLFALATFAAAQPGYGFDTTGLFTRDAGSCPTDYTSCGGKLPSDFCCPSSSTCLSLENDTTALCCPSGSGCESIQPITCEISQQNVTAYPKGTVKTTRLDDELPKCNDACCPFGYTCHKDVCLINQGTSSNGTTTSATTQSSSPSGLGAAVTPASSAAAASCPSFPGGAVAAGFFPGAVFGAVLALLITMCLRRRSLKKQAMNPDIKSTGGSGGNGILWSQRSSSGAVLGISSPIASEDASYRTDFLLRPNDCRRNSMGGRSTRSVRSRVRSLFATNTSNPTLEKDVPPLPTMPAKPDPVTPPRQREPSSESIKIYSPPGAFQQSKRFLGPEPYPGRTARPSTTFADLIQAVGFDDNKGKPGYKGQGTGRY